MNQNEQDNLQLTVIAAEIERQKRFLEIIRSIHNSVSGGIEANKVKHTIYALKSLLPKEEAYTRAIIDQTWKRAYDDEQVPSTITQNEIIKTVNQTFKTM